MFQCDGLDMCTFSVSNKVFGSDPCPNIYKYVVINYECVGSVTTQRPTGKSLWVFFVFYTAISFPRIGFLLRYRAAILKKPVTLKIH